MLPINHSINPITDTRWDDFVQQYSNASLYHASSWANLIYKTYGYTPYYKIVENNGKLQAALPLFMVHSPMTGYRYESIPFSDYCEPLFRNQNNLIEIINEVQDEMTANDINYLELRSRTRLNDFNNGWKSSVQNLNHILPLTDSLEIIEKNFHKNFVIRNIRKAQKCRVQVRIGKNENDMKVFYRLMMLTRRRHGLPPQPYRFFKNMFQLFQSQDVLNLMLAKYRDRTVAGIVIITFNDTAYYLYGGSDSQFHFARPNHLLLWNAIQNAHQNGCRLFDFGRTQITHKSLRDFKRRWGTEENEIYSYHLIRKNTHLKPLNRNLKVNRMFRRFIPKLPLCVLRASGWIIYKYFC